MGVIRRFRNGCQAFGREMSTNRPKEVDQKTTTRSCVERSRAQRSRRRLRNDSFDTIPTTSGRPASDKTTTTREEKDTKSRPVFSWTPGLLTEKLDSAELKSIRLERAGILDRYVKRVLSLSSSDQAQGNTMLTLEDVEKGKAHTTNTINYYNQVKGSELYSASGLLPTV
jgi:hypothetical protein